MVTALHVWHSMARWRYRRVPTRFVVFDTWRSRALVADSPASSCVFQRIMVRDAATWALNHDLRDHLDPVLWIELQQNTIVSGSADKTVKGTGARVLHQRTIQFASHGLLSHSVGRAHGRVRRYNDGPSW